MGAGRCFQANTFFFTRDAILSFHVYIIYKMRKTEFTLSYILLRAKFGPVFFFFFFFFFSPSCPIKIRLSLAPLRLLITYHSGSVHFLIGWFVVYYARDARVKIIPHQSKQLLSI